MLISARCHMHACQADPTALNIGWFGCAVGRTVFRTIPCSPGPREAERKMKWRGRGRRSGVRSIPTISAIRCLIIRSLGQKRSRFGQSTLSISPVYALMDSNGRERKRYEISIGNRWRWWPQCKVIVVNHWSHH